jgi:hypothetical protein
VTNAALVVNVSGKITTSGVVGSGAIILNNSTDGVTLTGAGSWTASGADVLIAATGADAATIGASGSTAATLTASGTAPTITVLAGNAAPNVLTIGANTTIALSNNSSNVLGSIVLTKADTNPSTLAFGGTGAQVTTGIDASGNSALAVLGGVFASTAAKNIMGVSAFATAAETNFVTITGAEGKLLSIVYGDGGGSINPTITGPTVGDNSGANDGVIGAKTDCVT